MENHISQIELINQYINEKLSETERQRFENQLQSNPEFNALYQEQLTFLEGLKRVQLKAEIRSAKNNYITTKWLKIIVLPIIIIGLGVLCYSLFIKTETTTVVEPIINKTVNVSDSISTKKQVKKSVDSVNIKVEKEAFLKETGVTTLSTSKTETTASLILTTEEKKFVTTDSLGTEESLSSNLISFYKSVKKEPQTITFNTEKPFYVTCKEGTRLTIPAKSFVDVKTGKLARGTINLEVTEYYKLSDMLLSNLSTKSDDKQLETGGMLYVEANKNGGDLKLKSDKRINIQFPDKRKDSMQLFSGEEKNNSINWKLQSNNLKRVAPTQTDLLTEEVDVQVPINLVEEPPIFPGCENETKEEKIKCFSDAIDRIVKKNFNNDFAEELNLNGKYRITVSFVVNKEGKIDEIVARASHTKLVEEAVRVVELLPQMIPAKQRGFNVIVPYSFPITFQIGESTKTNNTSSISFRGETQFEKQMEERLASKDSVAIREITDEEYTRYAFTTSNLGWINCDRFVRVKNKTKFKLKIKNAKGADVKLVFKSISSILPSKKRGVFTDFGDVPANEEVVLIAIKKVEDKLFLGIKETTTKPIDELDLDFKEVSVDKLKAEFQALNKDFN